MTTANDAGVGGGRRSTVLPPCCQALKVGTIEELSALAVTITREEIAYVAPDAESESRMKNLAMAFAAAAYRIAELHAPIPRAPGNDPPS